MRASSGLRVSDAQRTSPVGDAALLLARRRSEFEKGLGVATAEFAGGGGIEVELVPFVLQSVGTHKGAVRDFARQIAVCLVNSHLRLVPGLSFEAAQLAREE